MRLTGIAVIDKEANASLTGSKAFLRLLLVSTFMGLFMIPLAIIFLFALYHDKRRFVHDKDVATVVIHKISSSNSYNYSLARATTAYLTALSKHGVSALESASGIVTTDDVALEPNVLLSLSDIVKVLDSEPHPSHNVCNNARMAKGPQFLRFIWPIIQALHDLGGSAGPREAIDLVAERLQIPDDERAVRLKSGGLRVVNQGYWAGQYLRWAGFIDSSQRGKWALTSAGWELDPSAETLDSARELVARLYSEHSQGPGRSRNNVNELAEDSDESLALLSADDSNQIAVEDQLRSKILALSPTGFEQLCKRILTELGLTQLRAVGQSGDRGIDIEGHLRVSPVVSFRVGVQCKLYGDGNKIVPRQIREFQGALGPFDRGIYMTTSVFTKQAEEAAAAPGYKPIDLVDGERLVELLLDTSLGTKSLMVVDEQFFAPFL